MDPNANLRAQEDALQAIRAASREGRPAKAADKAELAELREALTTWIRGGGFEPDWHACPNAAAYYRKP